MSIDYIMFNVGYTINPSPLRRLVTAHINEIFAPHNTHFNTKFVQYQKMDDEDQKILLLWLLEKVKDIFKGCEFGEYYYERTQKGNLHIHGYFVTSKPITLIEIEDQIKIAELNKIFSSGNKFKCFHMEYTKKDKFFWNDKYILKDVNKIDLFTIPLNVDDSDFSEVV